MKVLAIDPGTTQSAYVAWDGERIGSHGIIANHLVRGVVFAHPSDRLAVEMIASYGMPVGREVFETCVWIGRFIEPGDGGASDDVFAGATPIYRRDVKLHLCGTVKAKDANIRQALIDRFGKPGTKAEPGVTYGLRRDEWAAFAVAVTFYDQQRRAS